MADAGVGAAKLYSMILLGLCGNYRPYMDPMVSLDCEFKSQYMYDLMTLRNKTFRITTVEKMPLSGTTKNAMGKLVGTGVAFVMFHEIQEKLGFNYEIIKPGLDEIGNKTHGVMKQLLNKEVDLAVMFFPLLKEYRNQVTFSESLGEFDLVLLMKRPLASATGSGLLAPFEGNVWYAILVSVIVVGPVVYLLICLRVKICEQDTDGAFRYKLPACIWFVYGALMKQGSTLSPISDSVRILFATWWIFITILTSFYTANLTAFLTLSQFTLTIKGPQEIESFKRYWVADSGGHTYEMINKADELQVLKGMIPKYGHYTSDSNEILPSVMKDVIYVSERRHATKLILNDYLNKTIHNVTESERCTYVLTKSFVAKPMAFAYPGNSTIAPLINPLLAQLVQGGIVDHLLDEPLPMTTICPLNLASSERKLKNADLKTTYYVVFAGFGAAFIAFVAEIIYRRVNGKPLGSLSINSGDIAGHILGQGGKNGVKGSHDINAGKMGWPDSNGNKKSRSSFLFQYTN